MTEGVNQFCDSERVPRIVLLIYGASDAMLKPWPAL